MDGLSPEARLRGAGATEHRIDMLRLRGPLSLADDRAGDAPPRAQRLPLMDPREWVEAPPPRRWAVPGWIPSEVVTALYGDGGIGKSLVAMQLLASTAVGAPWLGLDVMRGRSLGIFCEDSPEELQRRQMDINRHLGIQPSDLGEMRLLSRLGSDNGLVRFDASGGHLTQFHAELRVTCEEWRPDVLVLDTAADLYPDNENDRSKVRWFIQTGLASLARDFRCAVVLLAHPSASGLATGAGTGGSTAWNNTVRSRIYLSKEEGDEADPLARIMARKKANYAQRDESLRVIWHEGVLKRSDATAAKDVLPWETIQRMFTVIDRGWRDGKPWSTAPQTRGEGRYFAQWAAREFRMPEKRVKALVADWLQNGNLGIEEADAKAKLRGLRVLEWLEP